MKSTSDGLKANSALTELNLDGLIVKEGITEMKGNLFYGNG